MFNGVSISLSTWFEELRPWDPGSVVCERMVWINVTRVPTHAFKENFFKTMAQMVGRFVKLDEKTREKSRLDVRSILISTRLPVVIHRSFKVKITEVIFTIRLMEDSFFDPTTLNNKLV